MKILTILGTRPELIRLSIIIKKLDGLCDHILVHTGQNYDYNLNKLFFEQLEIRKPDYFLEATGTFSQQIGIILEKVEKIILDEKPDKFLILGDTNSGISAFIAKRLGIQVYHLEAGNRCYSDKVPEEVNRRVIDAVSDILMPYTERSRQNLIRDGIPGNKIYVVGNPINEVINKYSESISKSVILEKLGLKSNNYFLVTMHREENVDIKIRLKSIIQGLNQINYEYKLPVIISTHPRTRKRIEGFALKNENQNLMFMDPFGFFDFITLEKNAFCVISDSGTVQEECAIFGVPNVTIRDVTERPETIECGSNILAGVDSQMIQLSVKTVLNTIFSWKPPLEYMATDVSNTVVKILMGYLYNPIIK